MSACSETRRCAVGMAASAASSEATVTVVSGRSR